MRYYYMDAMRSVMMSLGVVLHAAAVYAVTVDWLVKDPNNSIFFDALVFSIHIFRIHTFFIIAGFFTVFSILKYGNFAFLKLRISRILIPLFSAAIILNDPEQVFVFFFNEKYFPDLNYTFTQLLPQAWISGDWVSHLWFLIYLIIYFLIGAMGYFLIRLMTPAMRNMYEKLIFFMLKKGRFLIILPAYYFIIIFLGLLFPDFIYANLFGKHQVNEFLYYLPFFLFGMLLYNNPELQNEFTKIRKWHIVYFLGMLYILLSTNPESEQLLPKIFNKYSHDVVSWFLCNVSFFLFYKFTNKPSRVFFYFSDASYSIYLFHHIVVVILGIFFLEHSMPSYLKFLLVASITLGITLFIHHFFILRYNVLSVMFNGKSRLKNNKS